MFKRDLTGKTAIVTGGSRGIGKYIALALHNAGAYVAITGRYGHTLEEATKEIGSRCYTFVCDQRNPENIKDMAEKVIREIGVPDILVNNAGVFAKGNVIDLSPEKWNEVIETNLTGTFLVTKAFLPGMIEKNRGDIFIISSMSGKKGDACSSAYNASKFGLQGFAQALTYEVRKNNIRVMVINPSTVDTGSDNKPDYGPGIYMHASDIAETIVHLACLPGRTLIRDMDIWGTNPFKS